MPNTTFNNKLRAMAIQGLTSTGDNQKLIWPREEGGAGETAPEATPDSHPIDGQLPLSGISIDQLRGERRVQE
jgi:hypothetical protein